MTNVFDILIYKSVSQREREKTRVRGKEGVINMIRTTKTCETFIIKH